MGILSELRRRVGNFLAMRRVNSNDGRLAQAGYLRLWVDDLRPAPRGWYHATSVEEAWSILTGCLVSDWSLDHDLGPGGEGYDLVKLLARYQHEFGFNFWPLHAPSYHTANPVGRDNMKAVVDRYGPYVDHMEEQ